MNIKHAAISPDGSIVTVQFSDNAEAQFHAIWLRDNCQDANSRDPGNGQRLFELADIAAGTIVQAATPSGDGGLRVKFSHDEHETVFKSSWLRANQYDRMRRLPSGWVDPGKKLFDSASADSLPVYSWGDVTTSDSARRDWLADHVRYGFTRLTGSPAEPGTVAAAARLFGFVRETNYGEIFEVRAEADPENLAYTSIGLSAHTDNPYRNPTPGLQLLHCIQAAGEGGESIVVDGFQAALRLAEDTPRHFAMLTEWPMRFEFRSKDAWLVNEAPMIQLETTGEVTAIRYNNRSASAPKLPFDATPAFYDAYRAFAQVINDPKSQVRFKLDPGDLFMVDNTRVLHGRSGFELSSGTRHLQGCYSELDGLHSTLRILQTRTGGEQS